MAGAILTCSECGTLLVALVIILSMLGVNISGLLLPAGAALAFAAKDLAQNFLAGTVLCHPESLPIIFSLERHGMENTDLRVCHFAAG